MTKRLDELLNEAPVFINIGVVEFGESLRKQGFVALDIRWSPPVQGDREMADLLDQLL